MTNETILKLLAAQQPGEPLWLTAARLYLGTTEIPGRATNQIILGWWAAIRAPFSDDETPWCAAFTGGILESIGIRSTRSARALSYDAWGLRLSEPRIGCIAVFHRGGGGHVGFVVRLPAAGIVNVLGGNQSNTVNVKPYRTGALASYRWPTACAGLTPTPPTVNANGTD